MNKPTRRRRASRAPARTLATAAAVAALVATLGAGQALAGPDERVLERQGRIDRQATAAQAEEQGKAEPSQAPSAQYPRRYLRPEPPMDTSPRLDIDEPVAPAPAPPAQDRDRDGLVITLAAVALLLAVGAATTWRIYRRPRPEPTA
jgi:type VI protein secretion system component VasF